MRRLAWLVLAVVVAVALGVGATGDPPARTEDARVSRIASEVRCPTCRGLSAEESDARAAQAVRDEIRRRVRAGETDAEIRGYLVSRYGRDILLRPEGSGVAGLVWALPVAALVLAGAGLAAAFARWRRQQAHRSPSPEERSLVEQVLRPGTEGPVER